MPQQDGGYGERERRRDREEKRRSQAQGPSNVVPPSPALVRNGSKQRKIPAVLTPGQLTPHPGQVHISIGNRRTNGQHPYAFGGYEYEQDEQCKPYSHASPMPPPVVSNVCPMGEAAEDYNDGGEPTKPSFFRILTCRC